MCVDVSARTCCKSTLNFGMLVILSAKYRQRLILSAKFVLTVKRRSVTSPAWTCLGIGFDKIATVSLNDLQMKMAQIFLKFHMPRRCLSTVNHLAWSRSELLPMSNHMIVPWSSFQNFSQHFYATKMLFGSACIKSRLDVISRYVH